MPNVTIDGRGIEVPGGTTILKAAEALGITIPTFCYHDGLPIVANCRICLVEVVGMPKPVPACHTEVREGMAVQTRSPMADHARKGVLEFILLNHPVDCPICDQAGECRLQDHYQEWSARPSRINVRKVHKPKALPIGPRVVFDGERCINCTLCVRFLREVTGSNQLIQMERGDHTEITTFPGRELDDPYSLCTVDLCPVGALTGRDFRFSERAWRLGTVDTVCGECARGCNVHADHSRGVLRRLRPRKNPEVNRWWACDEGRLAIHRWESGRLDRVLPEPLEGSPDAVLDRAAALLRGAPAALLLSPWASCEDAFVAGLLARDGLGLRTVAVAGRTDGIADHLLRVADRNPNRRGVLAVLGALGLEARDPAQEGALLAVGADAPLPEGREAAVVLTPFASVAEHAAVAMPTPSPFERGGTWINTDGRVQETLEVVPAPPAAVPDWLWLTRLGRRLDMVLPWRSLAELRRAMVGQVPALGGKP